MTQPQRIVRSEPVTPAEARRLNEIRRQAESDFPPDPNRPKPVKTGIGAQIRAAREARQLTWYSLAKLANISSPETVRDIEYGRNAQLADVEAIAAALGLTLELVADGQ
jgi:hypothetical protein